MNDQAHDLRAGEQPVVKSTVRARQGVTGHNVRYVLGFGLTAAVLGMVAVYFLFFPI